MSLVINAFEYERQLRVKERNMYLNCLKCHYDNNLCVMI